MVYKEGDIVIGFNDFDPCVEILESLMSFLMQFEMASTSAITNMLGEGILNIINSLPNAQISHELEIVFAKYGWIDNQFYGPIDTVSFSSMISDVDTLIDRLYSS